MNTVFVGGSRHISRLSDQAKERLNNIISSGARVIVGDANGADKAVQKYLFENQYENVNVFCSGDNYRNNLGDWKIHFVETPKNVKGFQFYAIKDREMAKEADYGLMIWDGNSVGTILNIFRLIQAGKKAVLVNAPEKKATTFKSINDWQGFFALCSTELRKDVYERATPEELRAIESPKQASFLDTFQQGSVTKEVTIQPQVMDDLETDINTALATGDLALVIDKLGSIAKLHGMSHVAKDAGLARESLYRSLSAGGNPEFATVYKVMNSVGLRLTVHKEDKRHV